MAIETSVSVEVDEIVTPRFTSVGYGIVALQLNVNKKTDVTNGMATMCPVSETEWYRGGEFNKVLVINDLRAEILALNDQDAIVALQAVTANLLTLCSKLAKAKGILT